MVRVRKRWVVLLSVALLTFALVVGLLLIDTTASVDSNYYLTPALATVAIFAIFSTILKWRTRGRLFPELGFIYIGLAVAYTVVPALSFFAIGFAANNPLAELLPSASELSTHLWRHVLFVFAVGAGYLLARGNGSLEGRTLDQPKRIDGLTIGFLLGMTVVSVLFLTLMSAPVQSYYENYVRYDHLSPSLRRLVSVFIRLNFGIYTVLLVFLFLNYRKYRYAIPVIVAAICIYETVHSFGSRIYAFVILLETAWLYHVMVKPIAFRKAFVLVLVVAVLFTAVEIYRPLDTTQDTSPDVLLEEGIRPPSELAAVFLTSFHLYQERTRGVLPHREWPMVFSDFISLVTFADFKRWDPMDWYARNYYPDALVPPLTLGPIADSAIWGGEIDLLLRGLVNGLFFAYLVRWFLRRKGSWWSVTAYVYCYALAVVTLKYSIFYILTPLLKTVLPTLILVAIFRMLVSFKTSMTYPRQPQPATVEPGKAPAGL